VDLCTCNPSGGFADLCAVWTDPAFDANQRAFYYARVLESPSCRWNQFYCNARQVDCSGPPVPQDENPPYSEFEYQQCCSGAVPSTVQQRAWTSPTGITPKRSGRGGAGMMRRWLRSPVVHFVLIGGLLFAVRTSWRALSETPTSRVERAPIVITAQRIRQLQTDFIQRWGR
jgi:hypothetical protein